MSTVYAFTINVRWVQIGKQLLQIFFLAGIFVRSINSDDLPCDTFLWPQVYLTFSKWIPQHGETMKDTVHKFLILNRVAVRAFYLFAIQKKNISKYVHTKNRFSIYYICMYLLCQKVYAKSEDFSDIFLLCLVLRARVCWLLRCLCRPFMIFEGWVYSNSECCRSKRARYQLNHPSPATLQPTHPLLTH